jgi:hypothetical protein
MKRAADSVLIAALVPAAALPLAHFVPAPRDVAAGAFRPAISASNSMPLPALLRTN